MKEIMIKGKFSLRPKTYIGAHKAEIKDIEIVKWQDCNGNGELTCYTIATFNEEGELISCGNRLLDAIESMEDLENIQALQIVGEYIMGGDYKVIL